MLVQYQPSRNALRTCWNVLYSAVLGCGYVALVLVTVFYDMYWPRGFQFSCILQSDIVSNILFPFKLFIFPEKCWQSHHWVSVMHCGIWYCEIPLSHPTHAIRVSAKTGMASVMNFTLSRREMKFINVPQIIVRYLRSGVTITEDSTLNIAKKSFKFGVSHYSAHI